MCEAREISLEEVAALARRSKKDLYDINDGECPQIVMHWSAGHYDQLFPDHYHFCITGDGEIYTACDNLSEPLNHTWLRNTGTIGIALCCCFDGCTDDLGPEPPTNTQIERIAQLGAVLVDVLNIPNDIQHVMTHAEAADNCDDDPYFNEPDEYGESRLYGPQNPCSDMRWDLQFLGTEESPEYIIDHSDLRTGGNVLRGKIEWYRHNK